VKEYGELKRRAKHRKRQKDSAHVRRRDTRSKEVAQMHWEKNDTNRTHKPTFNNDFV